MKLNIPKNTKMDSNSIIIIQKNNKNENLVCHKPPIHPNALNKAFIVDKNVTTPSKRKKMVKTSLSNKIFRILISLIY